MSRHESPTINEVRKVCTSAGFDFENLKQVRSKVYTGSLREQTANISDQVYVKLYPKTRREEVKEFATVAEDVGHPRCIAVEDELLCLVMEAVEGTPLSYILPALTFPGLWRRYKNKLKKSYEAVGKYLGALHTETESGTGPVLSENEIAELVDVVEKINHQLDADTVEIIKNKLHSAVDCHTHESITYGDRSPHNIFYHRGQITMVDSTCKRRSVVSDHSSVLMGVRLMIRRLPYARTRIRQSLENAFWNGYAETKGLTYREHDALRIRYLANNLDLLKHYDSDPTSLNSRLTKFIDPPIIRKEVEHCIQNLSH